MYSSLIASTLPPALTHLELRSASMQLERVVLTDPNLLRRLRME